MRFFRIIERYILKLDFDSIKDHLLESFSSESELIKSIEKLSINFTQNRSSIGEYLNDKKMVSAYTCFYMLTNIPKLNAALSKINLNLSDYSDFEFFDIGAGPGTFSLSMLSQNSLININLIEKSHMMIMQGEKLLKAYFPDSKAKYISTIPKKEKKRFGIFGHSANEMGQEITKKYINDLDLDFILFIEPGTKQSFGVLKELRKNLISEKYHIQYPCFGQSQCPLAEEDWCHQYLDVRHDNSTERLTQLARKDRRNLPVTIHFYTKEKSPRLSPTSARIIRVLPITKFSLDWEICYMENNGLKTLTLQVLTRGMKKSEIKFYRKLSAGDMIHFQVEKKLTDIMVRGTVCHTQN